jgi:hypothetical protein
MGRGRACFLTVQAAAFSSPRTLWRASVNLQNSIESSVKFGRCAQEGLVVFDQRSKLLLQSAFDAASLERENENWVCVSDGHERPVDVRSSDGTPCDLVAKQLVAALRANSRSGSTRTKAE